MNPKDTAEVVIDRLEKLKAREADLEKIAEYFEGQAWDESWPFDIIVALARCRYPYSAPFKLELEHVLYDESEFDKIGSDTLFYMMDVRDKDGKPLKG